MSKKNDLKFMIFDNFTNSMTNLCREFEELPKMIFFYIKDDDNLYKFHLPDDILDRKDKYEFIEDIIKNWNENKDHDIQYYDRAYDAILYYNLSLS